MAFDRIQQLGKGYSGINPGGNSANGDFHRLDINIAGILRPKMIKKKKEDLNFEEDLFLEELFDEFEESNVYAAS